MVRGGGSTGGRDDAVEYLSLDCITMRVRHPGGVKTTGALAMDAWKPRAIPGRRGS